MMRRVLFLSAIIFSLFQGASAGPLRSFLKDCKQEKQKGKTTRYKQPKQVVSYQKKIDSPKKKLLPISFSVNQELVEIERKDLLKKIEAEKDQKMLHENKNKGLEKQLAQMHHELQTLTTQWEAQKEKMHHLSKERDALLEEQFQMQKKLTLLEEERVIGEQEITRQFTEQIENIKQEYAQADQKLRQEHAHADQKIKRSDERHEKLLRAMILKEQDLTAKDKQIFSLNSQLTKGTDRITHLEHHVRELTRAFSLEKDSKVDYKKQIQTLSVHNNQLRMEKDELIKKLKSEVRDLKSELAKMYVQEEVDERMAQHNSLSSFMTMNQSTP